MKVCSSCSNIGEEIKTGSRKKRKSRNSSTPRTEKVIVNDYGSRIKEAREEEQISIEELAEELNEKSSLLSKLEKQDLKPDNTLAKKLSERLGVELYTTPTVHNHEVDSGDDRKATIGDVAELDD